MARSFSASVLPKRRPAGITLNRDVLLMSGSWLTCGLIGRVSVGIGVNKLKCERVAILAGVFAALNLFRQT